MLVTGGNQVRGRNGLYRGMKDIWSSDRPWNSFIMGIKVIWGQIGL
ncbi:hypothetical protein [Peribacillus sp. SCS-37]